MVLRFFCADGDARQDRLLLVNLGQDLPLSPIPEPLLAPPDGARWRLIWYSEAVAYGGEGTPAVLATCNAEWMLPGGAAAVFAPAPKAEDAEEGVGRT
jgi:maltooligosyltrehalose trehalohydrolase